MSEGHNNDSHYVKVWAILLALLIVSVIGPMFEILWLTLVTAFGIAVVKAYMVAKNFMHITVEKRYITYMVMTCLVFMFLLFAGVAPDVMKNEGANWKKPTWIAAAAEYEATGGWKAHHEAHGAGHGAEPEEAH
jgi:caa(3)-type oxidase subunit IV